LVRIPPPIATTARPQPVRRPYNPTATPNVPGQPVTDFTYPVGAQQGGGFRIGQPTPPPPRGVSRSTIRNLGGL
jgi:hypothetical protein